LFDRQLPSAPQLSIFYSNATAIKGANLAKATVRFPF
jgi:hypothetical protein